MSEHIQGILGGNTHFLEGRNIGHYMNMFYLERFARWSDFTVQLQNVDKV